MQTFKEFIIDLSKKTLGSYIKKAARDTIDQATTAGLKYNRKGRGDRGDKEAEKAFNRYHGIVRATKSLTKEETVNELSKHALGTYINRAAGDAGHQVNLKNYDKFKKRLIGISKATNKLVYKKK